tara:strand:+ start:126210 stop:126671 length:462 start_codon:yes stop_codon:yes gene_type:complete
MQIIFIILALIVLALSVYLGVLVSRILNQKKVIKSQSEAMEKQLAEQTEKYYESLHTLALVMEQGQVGVAEGCIRIKKLIDLDNDLRFHADLADFHKAYMDFSEFAYLDDYKNLSKQEQWSQDLKRQQFEQKHEAKLVDASIKLKEIIAKYRK